MRAHLHIASHSFHTQILTSNNAVEGFAAGCLVLVVLVLDCNAAGVLQDNVEVFVVVGAVAVGVRQKCFEKRRVELRDVRNCQQADQNPPKRRGSRQGFGKGVRGGFLVAAEVGVEVESAVEENDHVTLTLLEIDGSFFRKFILVECADLVDKGFAHGNNDGLATASVTLTLLEIGGSFFRKFILVECADLVDKGFAHGNNDGLATLAEACVQVVDACVQVVDEKCGNKSLVFSALLIPGVVLSHDFAELSDGVIIITTHLLCDYLDELCDGVQGVGDSFSPDVNRVPELSLV